VDTFFPTFPKPDNNSGDNVSDCYGYDGSKKHLIFSFWVYKNTGKYTYQQKKINSYFYFDRKLKKKLTGKSSGYGYLRYFYQTFSDKFSSSIP